MWEANLPDEYELKSFYLYLGIFDKSEITRICERAIGSKPQFNPDEEIERTDLEGNTCFARLSISPTGELAFESKAEALSVSTLPWAWARSRRTVFQPSITAILNRLKNG